MKNLVKFHTAVQTRHYNNMIETFPLFREKNFLYGKYQLACIFSDLQSLSLLSVLT